MKWLCTLWAAWQEFFQDTTGGLSMSRLMTFLAYFPAAYIAVATKSETMAGTLLTAYVLQYGTSRVFDVKQSKADNTIIQSTTVASTSTIPPDTTSTTSSTTTTSAS